ncbi:hypothetical protein ABZ897_24275 [Nonomuraea sp. NPDC046802]|uniref:MmyB family transcriptional regulator n=1 Tax=Nonomuraea sp. NPDC046802 TaxID=3154919 RepID=UPI0033CEF637
MNRAEIADVLRHGALAQALRLGDDDRDLVFRLAGHEPPQPGRIAMVVRPSVLRLLDRMADLPVLVLSAKGDVLAWNPLGAALQGDMSVWPQPQPSFSYSRSAGTLMSAISSSTYSSYRGRASRCV